jgi:hypothetical protein
MAGFVGSTVGDARRSILLYLLGGGLVGAGRGLCDAYGSARSGQEGQERRHGALVCGYY